MLDSAPRAHRRVDEDEDAVLLPLFAALRDDGLAKPSCDLAEVAPTTDPTGNASFRPAPSPTVFVSPALQCSSFDHGPLQWPAENAGRARGRRRSSLSRAYGSLRPAPGGSAAPLT